MKRVFFFGDGVAEGAGLGKERLGGKGAGLAEMTALGIPVPPGFTIETSVCTEYTRGVGLDGVRGEVSEALSRLEKSTGRRFGDAGNPLLVSVRSGARSSMPGMMDTILNLGLTARTIEGLSAAAGERFALDCRRRFLQMYGDVVLDVPKHDFEEVLTAKRQARGVASDAELTAGDLRELVGDYEEIVRRHTGSAFPDDPQVQLWGAIGAVFRSWDNERAKTYRRLHRIPSEWGTAVNVQAMVFGNRGETSATGVAFTRDPSTGEKKFYGEYLPNAQGEDVVAGIRTPRPLNADGSGRSLEETMPQAHAELLRVRDALEKRFRDMQDLEFTVEDGKLYLLQTRNGKRTGFAAVRIATDMVAEGLISEKEALERVEPDQLVQLLAPVFPQKEKEEAVTAGRLLGKGLPAGPGAASGRIAFTAEHAVQMAKSGPVVLVREETSPEDIAGMHAAVGILTTRGGMTCVAGETRLLTDRGVLSAEEAFRRFAEQEPLSVLSFDTTRLRAVFRRVIAAGGRPADVIPIAVSQTGRARGSVIRLTSDHKMFTIRQRRLEKKRLDEVLRDRDFLTVLDQIPAVQPEESCPALAYAAGAIFSDGHVRVSRTRGAVVFIQKPTAEKAKFIAEVEGSFLEAFGVPFTRVRRRETVANLRGRTIRGTVEDRFCTRRAPAARLFEIRQNLTRWVLGLDRESLLRFVAGYVDGDGTYALTSSRVRLQVVFARRNVRLLEGFSVACLRLGIVPQVSNNREHFLLQIAEGVEEILARCHRIKVQIPARYYASKCMAVNGLFEDIVGEVNFMGRVRQGIKRNLIFGVDKLRRDVLPLSHGAIRRRLSALLDSPLRSYRAVQSGASERTVVYNFEVDARDDLDKNLIVFSNRMTPVLISNSHAAVVARGMGKTCVVGAGEITVERGGGGLHAKNLKASEGDWISVDGTSGEVILGQLPTRPSEILQVVLEKSLSPEKSPLHASFARLLGWADQHRRLGVRANADTPGDARAAVLFGAEGIGLCRTEHMFFEEHRILAVREMILAETVEGRRAALAKILPMQRDDFVGLFREMGERPVTIRLLDPPLHEFLPDEKAVAGVAAELKVPVEKVVERVRALHEINPMLGHRGCRLGITHPEIYETQARAIIEAAVETTRKGGKPQPEIMIPLIGTRAEFERLRRLVDEVAAKVIAETGQAVSYRVGTMIEIPRAALQADKIAASGCEFFSFGTNDLTQMAYGYSRDDAASFLPTYIEVGILPDDPFASLDTEGVGELVAIATERGRRANPNLKVGICGEHGGDPRSIEFFHRTGLDYVSCSPYRVPVARLAAARAALSGGGESAISSTA